MDPLGDAGPRRPFDPVALSDVATAAAGSRAAGRRPTTTTPGHLVIHEVYGRKVKGRPL